LVHQRLHLKKPWHLRLNFYVAANIRTSVDSVHHPLHRIIPSSKEVKRKKRVCGLLVINQYIDISRKYYELYNFNCSRNNVNRLYCFTGSDSHLRRTGKREKSLDQLSLEIEVEEYIFVVTLIGAILDRVINLKILNFNYKKTDLISTLHPI